MSRVLIETKGDTDFLVADKPVNKKRIPLYCCSICVTLNFSAKMQLKKLLLTLETEEQ